MQLFGAHTQLVNRLGPSFQTSALANDAVSIEGAESLYGAPIISTQFHPEVSVAGLPYYGWLYKNNEQDTLTCLNIFHYFNNAANSYKQKKVVHHGIMTDLNTEGVPGRYDKSQQNKVTFKYCQYFLIGSLVQAGALLVPVEVKNLSSVMPTTFLLNNLKLLATDVIRPWLRSKVSQYVTKGLSKKLELNQCKKLTRSMGLYSMAHASLGLRLNFTMFTYSRFFQKNSDQSPFNKTPQDIMSNTATMPRQKS